MADTNDAAATATGNGGTDTGKPDDATGRKADDGLALTPEQEAAIGAADKPDQVRVLVSEASRRARQAEVRVRELEQAERERADADKSELEKATTRADRAEARIAELEHTVLRSAVAMKFGIPAEEAHRLIGTTEDELAADAKAFAKRFIPGEGEASSPDLGAGARPRSGAATASQQFSDVIRQRARR